MVSDRDKTEPRVTVVVDSTGGDREEPSAARTRTGLTGPQGCHEGAGRHMGEEVSTGGGQRRRGQGHGLRSQPPAPHFSPPLPTIGQTTCAGVSGFGKLALTIS